MPDDAQIVEVGEQASGSVVEQQETAQAQEPVQVVVVDGVEQVIADKVQGVSSDVMGAIEEQTQQQMEHSDAQHQELLTQLRSISDTSANADESIHVVTLSDGQWEYITGALDYQRQSAGVSLFVSFLTMLLVCIVIGTRLWSVMSRGWRS